MENCGKRVGMALEVAPNQNQPEVSRELEQLQVWVGRTSDMIEKMNDKIQIVIKQHPGEQPNDCCGTESCHSTLGQMFRDMSDQLRWKCDQMDRMFDDLAI